MAQTRNQIVDLAEPPICAAVDVLVPSIAQLALCPDALDGQDRLVDLRVVRLMGMTHHPTTHIIWQAVGRGTGARGG